MEGAKKFVNGDVVLLRSVYGGKVRWAFPHRVVSADDDRVALWLAPGTRGKIIPRDAGGRYVERWAGGVEPHDHEWWGDGVLRVTTLGAAHSIDHYWRDGVFWGWYANLQAPLRHTRSGFDTTDWALDLWVEPDGSWLWKDEEDFAELQELGVLDDSAAAAVRAEGERVIAAWPFPTGWEGWRPDPAWTPPQLPEDWHVVD